MENVITTTHNHTDFTLINDLLEGLEYWSNKSRANKMLKDVTGKMLRLNPTHDTHEYVYVILIDNVNNVTTVRSSKKHNIRETYVSEWNKVFSLLDDRKSIDFRDGDFEENFRQETMINVSKYPLVVGIKESAVKPDGGYGERITSITFLNKDTLDFIIDQYFWVVKKAARTGCTNPAQLKAKGQNGRTLPMFMVNEKHQQVKEEEPVTSVFEMESPVGEESDDGDVEEGFDLEDFEMEFDGHPGMNILRETFPYLFVAGVLHEISILATQDKNVQDLINKVFPVK